MTTLLAQSGAENQPTKIQRVAEVMEPLRVKKLSENATLPVRGSAGAAGYDLARWGRRGEARRAQQAPGRAARRPDDSRRTAGSADHFPAPRPGAAPRTP